MANQCERRRREPRAESEAGEGEQARENVGGRSAAAVRPPDPQGRGIPAPFPTFGILNLPAKTDLSHLALNRPPLAPRPRLTSLQHGDAWQTILRRRRQQPNPHGRGVVRVARLAQEPTDVDAVHEHVVTGSDAVDVDGLALLGGDVDVAPPDGGALEHTTSARLVPGTVALVHRPTAPAERRKRRTVVARQAETALVVAQDPLARQCPELVPLERLEMPMAV